MSKLTLNEFAMDGLKIGAIAGIAIGSFVALVVGMTEADEAANTKPAKTHGDEFAAVVASWNEDFVKKHSDHDVHSRVYKQYMRNRVIKYFGIVEAPNDPVTPSIKIEP